MTGSTSVNAGVMTITKGATCRLNQLGRGVWGPGVKWGILKANTHGFNRSPMCIRNWSVHFLYEIALLSPMGSVNSMGDCTAVLLTSLLVGMSLKFAGVDTAPPPPPP